MEHLVTFKTAEGRDGQHVAATLDDALHFIERVHNAEEASEIQLYRMLEVSVEFKTYVKAEVKGAESAGDGSQLPETAGEAPVGSSAASVPGETSDQASRRLFSRS